MAERFLIKNTTLPEGVAMPESSMKKQARNDSLLKQKLEAIKANRSESRKIRHELKMRTIGYEQEYANKQKESIQLRREARAEGGFYREPEEKVIFAIRIKGINKLAPKPKKVLQLFRLRQIHNGVFIRVNKATQEMLKLVQPFITYGYPSLKTVRELVYKRGYGKVNGQRVPLQDNKIISENLGKFGMHGVEDLVHELVTVGPHFKEVANFLWPFKLNTPRKGYTAKRHCFVEPRGGDWGNRETLINELVGRMN
eukprot:GDKH01004051.1.p1 GENE.GDKH01004051.1~~GDKH01004051.1.p1  ORF type:complete len:255 (-),score=96.26 GDKH01004051.1:114-878(-)